MRFWDTRLYQAETGDWLLLHHAQRALQSGLTPQTFPPELTVRLDRHFRGHMLIRGTAPEGMFDGGPDGDSSA